MPVRVPSGHGSRSESVESLEPREFSKLSPMHAGSTGQRPRGRLFEPRLRPNPAGRPPVEPVPPRGNLAPRRPKRKSREGRCVDGQRSGLAGPSATRGRPPSLRSAARTPGIQRLEMSGRRGLRRRCAVSRRPSARGRSGSCSRGQRRRHLLRSVLEFVRTTRSLLLPARLSRDLRGICGI